MGIFFRSIVKPFVRRMFVVVVAFGLPLGIAAADAQEAAPGAPVLSLTSSARAIGMAESGTADPTDPLNTVLNPSLLPDRPGVTGSYFYDELLYSYLVGLEDAGRESGRNGSPWRGLAD